MPTSISEVVVLAGGVSVPLDVLRLGWDLEGRGLSMRVDDNGLVVGPRRLLTNADRAAIRQHKPELLLLIDYCTRVM